MTIDSDHPDAMLAARLVRLALACIHREYPNHVVHRLDSEADALPPRRLTPAFFGSFDWHSAVHGHWCIVRLVRLFPDAEWAGESRRALDRSFTEENLRVEADYLSRPGREGFERPYGLAWLLQLVAELREWNDPDAIRWRAALAPLERIAVERIATWLPKLPFPIRTGEHGQTAFAMGLVLDWSRLADNHDFERLLIERSRDFYFDDRDWPLHYEPSGHDFLSPGLAEADLMRRVMPPKDFAGWLDRFLPAMSSTSEFVSLMPVVSPDPADGKLAHLEGLNLSRAWMLEGIAAGLPAGDERIPVLQSIAAAHRDAGLAAVTGEHYAGGHWLASFACYLLTRRGISTAT